MMASRVQTESDFVLLRNESPEQSVDAQQFCPFSFQLGAVEFANRMVM